jgi:hypothetical protein
MRAGDTHIRVHGHIRHAAESRPSHCVVGFGTLRYDRSGLAKPAIQATPVSPHIEFEYA